MVAAWLLAFLWLGAPLAPQSPTCYALSYDSPSQFADLRMFPSTLRLGAGRSDYADMAASQDTEGRWGTPLAWNTYRVRGDSIVAWLADGNREVKIAGLLGRGEIAGKVEIETDEAGLRRTAHVTGRQTECQSR